MTKPRKIAIIGAGPAGCMLARLLHLGGADVTVFEGESSINFRSQGGTLDLHTATGLAALKKAQLWDEFIKHARYDGQYMAIVDKDLTYHMVKNADSRYKHVEERPEIDRSMLRQILAEALPEGTVRWGHRLKTIEDGNKLVFEHTTEEGFDLIVGADGAWSKVRKAIAPELKPIYAGIGMHQFEIPDAANTAPEVCKLVNRGSLFASGEGHRLSVQQMGDGSLSIAASFTDPDPEWMAPEKCRYDANNVEEAVPALLKTKYADWCPELRSALEHAKGLCLTRSLFMLPVGSTWTHTPGVTLIGDAAHLMTPYAGEGVNQALEDAMLLAKTILEGSDDEAVFDQSIHDFETTMYTRVHKVQQLTYELMQDWMFTPGAPKSIMPKAMSRHVNHRLPTVLHPLGTAAVYAYFYWRGLWN